MTPADTEAWKSRQSKMLKNILGLSFSINTTDSILKFKIIVQRVKEVRLPKELVK